jgi:hypothetical protein
MTCVSGPASLCATAAPIPLDAPVTSTTRPVNRVGLLALASAALKVVLPVLTSFGSVVELCADRFGGFGIGRRKLL